MNSARNSPMLGGWSTASWPHPWQKSPTRRAAQPGQNSGATWWADGAGMVCREDDVKVGSRAKKTRMLTQGVAFFSIFFGKVALSVGRTQPFRRRKRLLDRDLDGRAHARTIGLVQAVGELERQDVGAGRQLDFGLGLALAEVDVLVVGRDHFARLDRRRVDQQVVVAGVGRHVAGRLDFHAGNGELDPERAGDGRAIKGLDKRDRLLGEGAGAQCQEGGGGYEVFLHE